MSLDGDLLVFALSRTQPGGNLQIGALLHHGVYDGALGANNSILVERDVSGGFAALYVASSFDVRKFVIGV